MAVGRKLLLAGAVALAMLLVFVCDLPSALGGGEGGGGKPAKSEMLDPVNTRLDLKKLDLGVMWRQHLEQVAKGRGIRKVYLTGNILVAEAPGSLFHFNATTGVWTATSSLKGLLLQPPVASEKAMHVLSGKGLLVIDVDSGQIRQRLTPRVAVACPPVVYKASLLLGSGGGKLCRFGLGTGRHIWKTSVDGPVMESPVFDEQNVYAVGYKGKVVAIEGERGTVQWMWRPKPPSRLLSGLTLVDGNLYVGDNRGYVYCLTAKDGIPLWKFPSGGPISTTPAMVKGKLLVCTYQSEALFLSVGEKPTVLWKHPDAERLIATGKAGMYVMTRDHSVAYILFETGKEKWRRRLPKDCAVTSDPTKPVFYLYRPCGAIMAIRELD